MLEKEEAGLAGFRGGEELFEILHPADARAGQEVLGDDRIDEGQYIRVARLMDVLVGYDVWPLETPIMRIMRSRYLRLMGSISSS